MELPKYYIFEEHSVTESIGVAYAAYSRFHDLFSGLTWRLSHDPFPADAMEIYPGIYAVRAKPPQKPGFCEILLVYSVDDGLGQISIVDIRIDALQGL